MKPLLMLDARTVTAMWTGAISGVGMKYMAKDNTSTVGFIGTGDQGWSHFQAELIITTTTSITPVIPDSNNIDLSGKHFAGSGAFKTHMQEIFDEIIK